MAGQRLYDSSIYSYAREEVRASGSFVLVATIPGGGATGALVASTVKGRGIKSVVASTTTATADTYTITFAEKFPQLTAAVAALQADTARAYAPQVGKTYTLVSGDGNGSTLVVYIKNTNTGAFVTPTAGDVVSLEAIFENQLFS